MKLKPCKDCGTEVSLNAKVCPKCGCDHPAGKSAFLKFSQALIVGLVGLMTFGFFYKQATTPDEATQQFRQYANESEANIQRYNEALKRAREAK